MGRSDQPQPGTDRLTVQEAAKRLDISEEAVRGRIKRGTLASERHDGHVFVLVERPGDDRTNDQPAALVENLQDQVRYLREQLRREQDAHAEARRLLAGALERIPAIEPPPEPPEAPESASDEQQGRGPIPDAASPQEAGARVSWWRKILGGGPS